MAVFRIPCSLREACGGAAEVRAEGADLDAALHDLEDRYPALRVRLATADGRLREFVRLFLNDRPVDVESHVTVPRGWRFGEHPARRLRRLNGPGKFHRDVSRGLGLS